MNHPAGVTARMIHQLDEMEVARIPRKNKSDKNDYQGRDVSLMKINARQLVRYELRLDSAFHELQNNNVVILT